jgi:elongation factor Ts
VDSYIHLGGKVGVLVDVGCGKAETASLDEFRSLVRDLTLHIAASRPRYLRREDVPAAEIASEREIYAQQVKDKPPRVIEKIVDGKLGKFFADVCLLEQPFVREVKQSITDLLAQKGKELGDTLCVRRFLDYRLGE